MKDRKMTRSPLARRIAALAAGVALAATVTACGGDAKAPQPSGTEQAVQQTEQQAAPAVFTFESAGFSSPKQLTIQLPEGLKTVMGADANNLLVNSYELAVRELDSPSYCAVDIKIGYANGGKEKIIASDIDATYVEDQTKAALKNWDEWIAGLASKVGGEVETAFTELFGPPQFGMSEFVGHIPSDVKVDDKYRSWKGTYEEAVASLRKDVEEQARDAAQATVDKANAVTPEQNLADRLFGMDGYPASELTSSPKERGAYVADDLESATLVVNCAATPFEEKTNDDELQFPLADGEETDLATAAYTVMKGGDITVRDHKVRDYVLGSDGHWLKD